MSVSDKKSKPVTEAYLERAALHYLGRYAATEAHLRVVLERKVQRRNPQNTPASGEQRGWIADVAAKCVRLGYVDDRQYATYRFESLLMKGKPVRVIEQDLRHKGVPADIVRDLLAEAFEESEADLNLAAAAAYAKRRRFGAFRRPDLAAEERLEKEKASMMRAGFSFSVVEKALSASEKELLELLG